jgi:pyruvate/2-oxoglutarate dehydrogenase complex dihydrolipoamide acyltransferase (E2) component
MPRAPNFCVETPTLVFQELCGIDLAMAKVRQLSVFGSVSIGLALSVELGALGAFASSGCKNQAPPAAEATAAEPAPPAPAAAPPSGAAAADSATGAAAPAEAAAAMPAASKYSEAGFDLVLQPKGSYTSGQAGEAEIVLNAKAPFHVNNQYPYKFKVKEAPGLKFANLVVAKDLVKIEPAKATVPVAFTPESAGKHTVAGQLSFSVCTDDKCMIEKRELALEIDAK